MEKVIIVRYCEIHLKGKNRGYFEKIFMMNLERRLRGFATKSVSRADVTSLKILIRPARKKFWKSFQGYSARIL